MSRTDSDNLIDAGRAQATPSYTTEERNGIPFLVNSNGEVISLEAFCATPIRVRGEFNAGSFESAMKFITKFKTPNTVAFRSKPLFGKRGTSVACIDFHSADGVPGFCEFVVRFKSTEAQFNTLQIPHYEGTYITPNIDITV
jgi:hypothetical protein